MMPVPVPVMVPGQGQWNAVAAGQQPPVGTIPLHTVIDHILQKTYHDIVVLSDLLPGKSDLERKIDIAHFANRTRQLVIRLLTVTKWAGSVSKVIKCHVITQHLDRQGLLFIDTADKLHTLANQLVVQARLPNFAIPAAIDVLTTGTYPRLPNAIRDKVIPPDPITPLEKAITLKRLDEVICHRLAVTKIPLQITDIKIDSGMVKLIVPGEFKAILTLMSQSDDIPWRLLKIYVAVEDRQVGAGKELVHPLQIQYVHELVQSRLIENKAPLQDLYDVLHSFCLSLKIEVLEAQARRLLRQRWGRLIHIEEYHPGNKVVLSYWRTSVSKGVKPDPMSISIHQEKQDETLVLRVHHKPSLILENVELVEQASTIQDLSLERLLGDTILLRSFHKLHKVSLILKKHSKNDCSFITKSHSCLVILLAKSFRSCGKLYLSVDPQTGTYVCASTNIPQETLDELEHAVNESIMKIVLWIPKLKQILAKEHCRATVQNLPAVVMEKLPVTNVVTHDVGRLGDNVIYLKLTSFDSYYIVVQSVDNEHNSSTMSFKYHLLRIVDDNTSTGMADKKADVMVELNALNFEHLDLRGDDEPRFENSELALIVSACNSRIPFIELTHDLTREGLVYQGLSIDGDSGLSIKLLDMGALNTTTTLEDRSLITNTLQCSFRYRLIEKTSKPVDAVGFRFWYTELVFANVPLKVEAKQGRVTRTSIKLELPNQDTPAKSFKEVWNVINKLYEVAVCFSDVLYSNESNLKHIVTVHSYDYQSLVLKYGAKRGYTVAINWSHQNQAFVLHFGRVGSVRFNGHSYATHYLTAMFNTDNDLGRLVQVLHDTIEPLQMACSISSYPVIGMAMGTPNAKFVCDNFSVIVQGPTRFLLVYRSILAVEICCLTGGRIAIRDGALSKCDSSILKEGLQPITGLVNFLTTFSKSSLYFGPMSSRDDPVVVDQLIKMHGVDVSTVQHGNWAGNSPVVMSHSDFAKLMKEQRMNARTTPCMLEQFWGLAFMMNSMTRFARLTDAYYFPQNVTTTPSPSEISHFQFAVNSLLARCSIQFNGERLALTLKLQQVPSFTMQERGLQPETWHTDNLHTLERFFQVRVVTYPYRPNNMLSFCTIITSKSQTLSDFINIMRFELADHQNDPTARWIPKLCLTMPPRLPIGAPYAPAVFIKEKILTVVMLSPKNLAGVSVSRQSVLVPMVLYPTGNIHIPPCKNYPYPPRLDALVKQHNENRPPHGNRSHLASLVKYLVDNYTTQ